MTHVALHVAGDVAAGAGVAAAAAGSIVQLSMNAGDVVELLGKPAPFADSANADLSRSVLNADKPIQVVSSVPITTIPSPPNAGSCCGDHLEEVIAPAEGLSKVSIMEGGTIQNGCTSLDACYVGDPSMSQPSDSTRSVPESLHDC